MSVAAAARIRRKGPSNPQQIPAEVQAAYERLVAAGYTRRLIPGE